MIKNFKVSLHIGINKVDPAHYGSELRLNLCVNDANAYAAIARQLKFNSVVTLINEQATSEVVSNFLEFYTNFLREGDTLWITYSGHGSQVPNKYGDDEEKDFKDETWVLYDRMFIDDEFYNIIAKAREKINVVVVSDSCHSGTVTRSLHNYTNNFSGEGTFAPLARFVEEARSNQVLIDQEAVYRSALSGLPRGEDVDIKANVLLMSGCDDAESSLEFYGAQNGSFTTAFLSVFNNGAFKGSYNEFHNQILATMPRKSSGELFQTPQLNLYPKKDEDRLNEQVLG